jgi:hypothetical protein
LDGDADDQDDEDFGPEHADADHYEILATYGDVGGFALLVNKREGRGEFMLADTAFAELTGLTTSVLLPWKWDGTTAATPDTPTLELTKGQFMNKAMRSADPYKKLTHIYYDMNKMDIDLLRLELKKAFLPVASVTEVKVSATVDEEDEVKVSAASKSPKEIADEKKKDNKEKAKKLKEEKLEKKKKAKDAKVKTSAIADGALDELEKPDVEVSASLGMEREPGIKSALEAKDPTTEEPIGAKIVNV